MSTTQRHPRLNRLAAMLIAAGCVASPVVGQTTRIIGDSGVEVVDVPPAMLPFNTLILGNTAAGNGTLNFDAGALIVNHGGGYSGYVTVGNLGLGTINQTNGGGDSVISITGPRYNGPAPGVAPDPWGGYLFIGRGNDSTGSYVMSDTSGGASQLQLNVEHEIQIGGSNVSTALGGGFSCATGCTGSFVQNGGEVNAGGITIGVGFFTNATGSYTINSGTLNSFIDLGNSSQGNNTFTQNGGVVNANMFIGNGTDSQGTYTLNDGTVNSDWTISIGQGGTGTFAMKGGIVNSTSVALGFNNVGTFEQSAGQHNAYELLLGIDAGGVGVYKLSGGTLTVQSDMIVGRGYLGIDPGVTGLFRQTGGEVVTNTLWIGGDTRTPLESHFGRGRYELVDGTVTSQFTTVGNIGPGSVLQTGGTFNAGVLRIGSSGSFNAGGSLTEASTYNLQAGQLNTTGTTLSLFGMGTFNHSGGEHNVTGNLVIGSETAFVDPFPALGRVLQGIYNLSGGLLNVTGTTAVGAAANSSGTFNQSGGIATLSGALLIGKGENSNGTYNLSGTGELHVSGAMVVGHGDTNISSTLNGLFTQSGGTVSAGELSIGGYIDSSDPQHLILNLGTGRYVMSNGALNTDSTTVGNMSVGTFDQSGGVHTTGSLSLGICGGCNGTNSDGLYNLTDGSLIAGSESIGLFGRGSFIQLGGSNTVTGMLALGNGPIVTPDVPGGPDPIPRQGSYTLSGNGTLTTDTTVVGNQGVGFFTQNGGTHNSNLVVVGAQNPLIERGCGDTCDVGGPAQGTYAMNDGLLNAGRLEIGGSSNGAVQTTINGGNGLFKQNGGVVTVTSGLGIGQFGGTGQYDLNAGMLSVTGTAYVSGNSTGKFNQTGGTFTADFVNVGILAGGTGSYAMSGGDLLVSGNLGIGGPGAKGTFTHTGGNVRVDGSLYVNNDNTSLTSGGSYALSGATSTLTVGGDSFIGNSSGGTPGTGGLFVQSGGTATFNSVLTIGAASGDTGLYALSGGTLRTGDVGGSGIGDTVIGASGIGELDNSGGTHQSLSGSGLTLGFFGGGQGTYKLSGTGVLEVTGREFIGAFGTGTFVQSGNTQNTADSIWIGTGDHGGSSYSFSGGTIHAGDMVVGFSAQGSFNHTGGINLVAGDLTLGLINFSNTILGNGTYALGGSGSLNVGGNLVLGNLAGATGTFTYNTAVGDAGSITGLGGTLVVGDAGTGSFIHGSGLLDLSGSSGGLVIGRSVGGGGIYTQNGGTLIDSAIIGDAGTGTYNNNAAIHTVNGSLILGNQTTGIGTYNNNGGTNTVAGNVIVGNAGAGTYNLNSGGNLAVSGLVTVQAAAGSTGVLNVSGGTLSAANINNRGNVNYSAGSVTLGSGSGTLANNAGGQVNFSGTGTRVLSGNLANAGAVTLTAAARVNVLANNGGTINLNANNLTVTQDYTNANFGSGNSFNKHAGVSGTGQIAGLNASQTITGQVSAAGSNTFTLDLGNVRGGGGSITKNYQVLNNGTGADIRGAIQTAGLGNITDARLTGGVTATNFGPIAAGADTGNLSVTFTGAAGAALNGQKIAVVSNFDNVASQIINVTGGAVSALAVGNATPTGSSTAVNLGNFRIGTAGADTGFSVQNQTSGAGAEQLGINGVSASSGFTAANAFGSGLIGPGAAQAGAVTARASGGGAAGVNTGTVTINYATDGTNVDASFSRIAANSQVINVQATGWNLANGAASPAGPVNLGNFHVGLAGGAAPQSNAIDITNNAPNLGFTEQLKVNSAGVSGAFALTNNIGGTAVNAGATFTNGLNVARNGGVAGLNTGTLSIQYLSDGTGAGNSGFSAIAANNQAITVNATGYRLASVNAIAAVNFNNVHVGDSVSQALLITNTAINDGFSEKLNASFGGTTDARITTSGSFALLAAGQSNASSLIVGLNTTAAGSVNGTARVLLTSDGAGTSGLGTTALTPQDVGVSGEIITSGSVFRLASASPVAPNPVNFGNVRVGASTDQALTITNTAANDGFSEKLNASIGEATAGVTSNGGSFALLAAQGSNSTSLHVGLDTSSAGAKNGSATISLVSDGAGTSNLGQTPLPSQTVTITGGVYNMAVGVATPDPIVFANRRVGDAATQALTVANNAAGGGFSEALNASFSGASGAASNNGGTVLNLAAGSSNAASMNVGLNTGTAGARSGTVTLAYQSDGTGANGNSGLAAIAAGTQTISVSGNVYNAAVGNASPAPIVMSRRVNDVATQTLTVSNSAAAGLFSEALNAGFSASTGSASHNGGGISNLIAGGSDASAMSVSLNTSTAGAKSGTVTLAYQTDGTGSNGHSGLTAIAAGTQTISVSGNVYTAAVGQVLPPTTINFGVVHVGDVVGTIGIAVKNNAAVTALNDQLTGAITLAGGAFSASGNLGAGLGAGQTDSTSLRVGVNTSAAGVLTGSASVNLSSHNAEMADLLLGTTTLDLQAQVNNYANLDIIRIPGLGTFTRSGNVFTLNLGAFALGSGTQSATLNVKNAVSDPADDADGGFCLPGSPCSTDGVLDFALGGFSGFHDLQAGHSSGDLTIGFNTLAVGTYEDDIDLNWFGHNANWTQDGLTHYTLRILGTVYDGTGTVPEPGNLVLVLTALGLAAAATRRRRVRSSFGKQSPCAAKLAA
ncbi:MAG: choice-of-anchor D domain-containing protein [Ideonella sp.]|nr:choice-of-anchor D domain-containing protein [Ideonella sp.]